MRVHILEPDWLSAHALILQLDHVGHTCTVSNTAEDALETLKPGYADLVIIELDLTDGCGFETLQVLFEQCPNMPLLVLSQLTSIKNKVRAFEAGATDYVTKPFSLAELNARILAIVRRSHTLPGNRVDTGALVVDFQDRSVRVRDRDGILQGVHLTNKEFQMIELLALKRGKTITKEMFLNHLYGDAQFPEAKIIDVFIAKVRRKLEAVTGGHSGIDTIWGRGYTLTEYDSTGAHLDTA